MLSSAISFLDSVTLLKFLVTAFLVGVAVVRLVRDTASRYPIVGRFGEKAGRQPLPEEELARRVMAVAVDDACFVCRGPSTKKCSRCKAVRYCSPACQRKDWDAGHKMKCNQAAAQNDTSPITTSVWKRPTRQMEDPDNALFFPAHRVCRTPKKPRKVLFPYDEFVELFNWNKPGLPPCGLLNCGNSCFANVVLQCLASTRPVVAYLLERDHSKDCSRNDWCFLCELQTHVRRVRQSLHPFSPINILSRIPNIGGNLGYGKQEDAHEFMRFAIDTMQSICLDEFGGEKVIEPSSQETTLIHHIFGGHLQSQVICSKCSKISNRYENMMDLTVEIQGDAESLEECLNQFTAKEWLEGENMYKCDGCNAYVTAWKRLTVHQAPNILTIALKRFQGGRFGKLNKRVTFPETLDLGPYMSEAGDDTNFYRLYAVVVHVDMLNASFFGHYICYTKANQGYWYRIDDCKVIKVDLEEALSQRAYMLLYSRINVRPSSSKSLERLKKDEQAPGTEEPQSFTSRSTNALDTIGSVHATSPGRLMSDLSMEHEAPVQIADCGMTGNEDSVDDLVLHARSNGMDLDAVPTSEKSSSSVAFDESCSSYEVSVSRNDVADSAADMSCELDGEGCTTSNSKWDLYECNGISSKHNDRMELGHGQFKYGDSSVNGISHAAASPESTRDLHVAASSSPTLVSTTEQNSVPSVCGKVENGIVENEGICSNEITDDNTLLSPKESLLRSFRRPKPLFRPGFLDKAARRESLDNYNGVLEF